MTKIFADKAATDTMRDEINKIELNGQVVIGEGELDEAPMLYIGEKLGSGGNIDIDIAVDPLEGTNFVAKKFARSSFCNFNCRKGKFLMLLKLIWIKSQFQKKYPMMLQI